ncbi:MAG TPA: cytotoxic translational repressor of toxin-antitoxin stability system [Mycobacteriales bacterium]
MNWPAPTRADHDRFCQVEGWRRVRDAKGRTGTHHVTYELGLPDGRVLRTRISHPVNRDTYGAGLWNHILRDQLEVAESVFWKCVQDQVRPDRGWPVVRDRALPAEVVHLLVTRVGLSASEIQGMTKEEALLRLTLFWTDGT